MKYEMDEENMEFIIGLGQAGADHISGLYIKYWDLF